MRAVRLLFVLLLAGASVACSDDQTGALQCDADGDLCADGTVCVGHACVPCANSPECGALACISGRCRACADDVQCGPGRVCEGGVCRGCSTSAECHLGLACVSGACVPCGSSTDCGDGRACIDGECAACEATSQCDNGKVCKASACVACADNAECPSGLACVAGACGSCSSDEECTAGQICAGGRCGECQSRSQCDPGELCSAGRCLGCGRSEDCEQTEACVAGLCGRCGTASDCRLGQVCRDGECGACGTTSECPDGLVCRNRVCETCTSAAQCATGQVCVAGHCRDCGSSSECSPGEACVAGKCGPCTSPDQCDAGLACVAGVCGPCTSYAHCREGEICRASTRRCGQPGAPDHLELVGGQNQTGLVNTRLAQDVAVRVVDVDGEPVPNVTIAFAPTNGSGTPGAATMASDRAGLASTTWKLGTTAGPQQLNVGRQGAALPDRANTGRAGILYNATAQADRADHLDVVAGHGQSVAAGTRAPIDPQIRVVDRYGNGIPSIPLKVTVTEGGGTAGAATLTSGAGGLASTSFTPGTVPATNRLVFAGTPALPDVDSTGRASVTFTIAGVTGPADHLEKVAGDNQSGAVGSTVSIPPKVRLLDRFNNRVSGVALSFTPSAGTTVGAGSVTTDTNGEASTSFTFGTSAGTKTLVVGRAETPLPDAAGTGRATVTFTEVAVPGAADHLDPLAGDGQSALAGTPVAVDPEVRVVDRYGNGLQNVAVAFTPMTGGGSAAPAAPTSDHQGRASTTWTLGFETGAQTLVAARAGTPLPDAAGTGRATVTFTAAAPVPTVSAVSPMWLPIAGGTLTIDGTNFAGDATVKVGGTPAAVTTRTPTRLVVTAPRLARGPQPVVVTSAGSSTAAVNVLYVLKFTPRIDGTITTVASENDWPIEALVAQNVNASGQDVATNWDGNELRQLYMGYDDQNFYVGIVGRAQKHNAIVGFIYENGITDLDRPNASPDIRQLQDGLGDGSGDGSGCVFYGVDCTDSRYQLSLDDMLSSGFNVTVPGWKAYYAFGRTGNAIDIVNTVHNATGGRDLFNRNDFGWSRATVKHTNNANEFAFPRTTFAAPNTPLTKIELFVRIVGNGGQAWANQGLPADANSISSSANVSSVATMEVR